MDDSINHKNEKSLLFRHLIDLRKVVNASLRFGVEYIVPDYFKICDLEFDIGSKIKPVSSFSDLLLWIQLLLEKCENDEHKRNSILFENSILQIEAIIANSLLNADFFPAYHLYNYIFKKPTFSSGISNYNCKSKLESNLIYFLIRYAIHSKKSCDNAFREHLYILSNIYANSLDYDIFVLLFSFKFFVSDLSARKKILQRFYDFHELYWVKFQDVATPAIDSIISCTDTQSLEIYSARDVIAYEHDFDCRNYYKKFGYLVCYANNSFYSMNPSNCINNTFLPFGQILIDSIQNNLVRARTKIFVAPDSKESKPNVSEDIRNNFQYIPGNSYLIVHDGLNWYHFMMETMIPLHQTLVCKKSLVDSIIVPSSVYDNQNRLQLLETLVKTNKDFDAKIIRFEQSLRLDTVYWSAITYPQSTHLNGSCFGSDCGWPSHIIADFSDTIKSSSVFNQDQIYNKIYLKRASSLSRQCTNIAEVENLVVNNFEFEAIELEKYSLHEQIFILSNSKFIIGPTGAAWTNIIFCNKNRPAKAICWGLEMQFKDLWIPLAKSANVKILNMYTKNGNSYNLDCSVLAQNIEKMFDSNFDSPNSREPTVNSW